MATDSRSGGAIPAPLREVNYVPRRVEYLRSDARRRGLLEVEMWHRRAHVLVVMSVVAALVVPFAAAPAAGAPGSVQGTVFRDTDFDGAFDGVEVGQVGVEVTLVDATGAIATTTSGDDGTWTIPSAALTGPFRVEFSIPSTLGFIAPGPMGTDNIGPIDFAVDGDETVDFGVVNPAQYCQDNPDVALNCYVLYDQVGGANAAEAVLVGTEYLATGDGAGGTGTAEVGLAAAAQIGTTWGLGYQTFLDADESNDLLYAAAFMKRFSGYAGGGSNAIYVVDDSGVVTDTFNIGTAAADPHDFTLVSGGGFDEVRDAASYAEVGRQGFGDLDLSEDQTRLYVMQLADDELVEVDVADPAGSSYGDELRTWDVTGVSLGAASCGAGLLRPFATAVNDGKVYIGTVCEGPARTDLRAFVHEMDPATATGVPGDFRLVTTVDLDYAREPLAGGLGLTADWQVWDDTFQAVETDFSGEFSYPQAMLSDIVFDNGDMILGLRDRYGDQSGDDVVSPDWPTDSDFYRTISGGDTIRACGVTSAGITTWVAENDPSGSCDSSNGAAASGPNAGQEWYPGDLYIETGPAVAHEEISLGGLAQNPVSGSVLSTGFDTLDDSGGIDGSFSAGLMRLDNTTGARTGSYRVIGQGVIDPAPFGKAAGLGDVETRCVAAPLEIGNYVWFDADGDGIADPGEEPLEDVVVNIYADTDGDGSPNGLAIGSVTTTATGHYVFTDADVTGGLDPDTDYVLEFDIATNSVTGPGGQALSLTTVNATTDSIDSDPTDIGSGLSQVALTTGGPGSFDHTFDAGYTPGVRIGNLVWLDTDDDGTVDSGEAAIPGVTVNVYADDGNGVLDDADIAAGPIGTTTTDAAGNWWLDVPADGVFYAAIPAGQAALAGLSSSSGPGSSTATNTTDNNDDGDAATVNATAFASITGPITATTLGLMPTGEEDSNTGTAGGGGAETYVNTESGVTQADNASNLTIDMGFAPAYEIGNLVWFDTDNDGVVDPGEPTAAGVTVRLLDGSGNEVATTTTDGSGNYAFAGLRPGDFIVEIPASQFATGAPLDGWYPSTGAGVSTDPDGDVDNNSDGAAVAGGAVRSGTLTLGPGEPTDEVDESANGVADANSNLTVDFGFYQLSLGDQLWIDADNSGTFDPGEDPAPGVTVELLDESGTVLATTTSATDGTYTFTGLEEGTYSVRIPASQFAPGGPLNGRTSSTGNDDASGNAPDPDDDVNNDDNGDLAADGSVVAAPVTLSAADEPGTDGIDNPTVDFGFIPVGSIAGEVWEDDDKDGVLDPDEDPIPDVVVNLIDTDTNTVVNTMTTGPDGSYLFPNLPPGNYVVEIIPPNRATVTTPQVGSDLTDSDIDPATNRTPPIVLGLGENVTDVDAGIVVPPALAITGLLGHWPNIVFFALLAVAVGALFVSRRELLAEVIAP